MDKFHCVVQAPDVTEITCCQLESVLTPDDLAKEILTEFAWVTTSPRTHKRGLDALARLGFKRLTSMRNWYPGHYSEWRRLDFYWKRLREKAETTIFPNPRSWGSANKPKLSASGCGFAFDTPPILNEFNRVFSLVRVPLVEHQERTHIVTLEKFNYRLVDVGSQAAFFINGWDPDKWNREVEMEYFNTLDITETRKPFVEFEEGYGREKVIAPVPPPVVAAAMCLRDEHGRFAAKGPIEVE